MINEYRGRLLILCVVAVSLALPAMAAAHLERPSYWPDPAPDRSVSPAAGGKVPDRCARSAPPSTGYGPGEVRVVCEGRGGWKSIAALRESIHKARKYGYRIRPSQPKEYLSRREANDLLRDEPRLAKQCRYHEIQPAVFDSGNNDRVVIMPGRYTEPTSRAQPLNDPRCTDMTQTDSGGAKTPSYKYQVTCPNDQNLIHVQGRAVPLDAAAEPAARRTGRGSPTRALRPLQPPDRGLAA